MVAGTKRGFEIKVIILSGSWSARLPKWTRAGGSNSPCKFGIGLTISSHKMSLALLVGTTELEKSRRDVRPAVRDVMLDGAVKPKRDWR